LCHIDKEVILGIVLINEKVDIAPFEDTVKVHALDSLI
jgi:hypothetical protein